MTPSSVRNSSAPMAVLRTVEVPRTPPAWIAATGTVLSSFSSPASVLPLASATSGGSPTSATGTAEVSFQNPNTISIITISPRCLPHSLCHIPGPDGAPRVPL